MLSEFVASYGWIVWLALILIFVIIEVFTVDFTFLMIAIGSLGGLLSGLFGIPWYIQVIIAGILALALLFAVRPPLLRMLKRGGDKARSNVDALLGIAGIVTVDFQGNPSHVKLANGETWTARFADPKSKFEEGDHVVVTAIEGATAVVALAGGSKNV